MFKKIMTALRNKETGSDAAFISQIAISTSEKGIVFPQLVDADLMRLAGSDRNLAAFILQLNSEEYVSDHPDGWILNWVTFFILFDDEDYQDLSQLIGLPVVERIVPVVSSQGALSDSSFQIIIRSWRMINGRVINGALAKQGPIFQVDQTKYLMPKNTWMLTEAIQEFSKLPASVKSEQINQDGWARIRKLGVDAGAVFDGFLEKTIVVKPDSLRLKLNKSDQAGIPVIEVIPEFDEQPDGWLDSFDGMQSVQNQYSIATVDGGIAHVLISPEVKTVLREIRSLPGRRVAGDRALQLIRNPYTFLGDDANKVINLEQFEKERAASGLHFLRFSLSPEIDENQKIVSITLKLDAVDTADVPTVDHQFQNSSAFDQFVGELKSKFEAGVACGYWHGYELELSDLTATQLDGIEQLLRRWKKQDIGDVFADVLDLSLYGDRVTGIGIYEKPSSPFLTQSSGQKWLPESLLDEIGLDGALLAKWDKDNVELLNQFKQNIETATAENSQTVLLPGIDATLSMPTAVAVAAIWEEKLKVKPPAKPKEPKADKSVLQIDDNIASLSYVEKRAKVLQLTSTSNNLLPKSLLPHVSLKDHQVTGVAWLQHLFACSPMHASGCVLADDMGLGKTLQLLTFISGYLESTEKIDPILIVAPVSLLDNWENEMKNFFAPNFASVLKLYGSELSSAKFAKNQLPSELTARGIFNLLKPNWRNDVQIVLTTYETLRDQEFSLARQQWSIMICDEAQKIKNPAALVTQAAKAMPARFKVACTGTPVENSLTDLWCLFDFIQPGFLGALNEFGSKYRPPVEGVEGDDDKSEYTELMNELRELIDPQILRRLKSDVAKDLPLKTESTLCKNLEMGALQVQLYQDEIKRYKQSSLVANMSGGGNTAILGLLHTMKMICAHPHSIHPKGDILDVSPKMRWLLTELSAIKTREEKVIVFTELREIQRALQLCILDNFGMHVTVINGDTNASSEKGPSRQKLIDIFQAKPGFGVIILSTSAVGFGVNVQAANHVIHFTRSWNPAKEDQATDRAYRIGQTKEVFVYYPTVTSTAIESTFEQKLDNLLTRKRLLATDMLNGVGDVNLLDLAKI